MRSNAQRDLEAMLPDLDALLEKRLFTKEELKHVLNKRAKFEHAIRSSTRTPQDFYKYIEFEEKLEELRKLRAARVKKEGEIKSPTLTVNVEDVWQEKEEFKERQNVNMARSLMQRALRTCKLSQALWIEYFRLELSIVQQLWERQQILLESNAKGIPRGCDVLVDEWMLEEERDLGSLLDGSMALCVFREAARAIPSNFEFRKRFLDVVADMSLPDSEKLNAQIIESIQQDFGDKGEAWDMKARFEFSKDCSSDLVSKIEHSMKIYSKGLACGDKPDLYSYAVLFLADIWEKSQASNDQEAVGDTVSDALFRQMESILSTALENSCVLEDAVMTFAEICRKRGDITALLRILPSAIEKCPRSGSLEHAWIDAVKESHLQNEATHPEETENRLLKILKNSCAMSDVWRHVIETCCDLQLSVSWLLDLHFQRVSGILATDKRREASTVSCHFLKILRFLKLLNDHVPKMWLSSRATGLVAEAMRCAQMCLDCPIVDLRVYLEVIDLYEAQLRLRSSSVSFKDIERLLEKAVRAHGASHVEIWIEFVRFEHEFGQREIGAVYQRALHSGLQDLRQLEDAMRALQ